MGDGASGRKMVGRGSRITTEFREGKRISSDAGNAVRERSPSRGVGCGRIGQANRRQIALGQNAVVRLGERWDRLGAASQRAACRGSENQLPSRRPSGHSGASPHQNPPITSHLAIARNLPTVLQFYKQQCPLTLRTWCQRAWGRIINFMPST